MKKTILFPAITCLALLLFVQCEDTPGIPEDSPLYMLLYQSQVIQADNAFGFKLMKEASESEPEGENVVISPFSVAMALSMLYNGADGSSRDAIHDALEYNDLSLEQINWAYKGIMNRLPNLDEGVDFSIANAVFYEQLFAANPDFLATIEQYYGGEIAPLDFQNPNAVNVINDWVNTQTNGKIPTILEQISSDEVMFLINAIYFNGSWTKAFDPGNTFAGTFYQQDGSTSPAQMMSTQAVFPYYEDAQKQAVDLAYADSIYSMTVILPKPGEDIHQLAESMDNGQWLSLTNGFNPSEVILQLPKFTITYDKRLQSSLTDLGMGELFGPTANLSNISNDALYVSQVRHKTFIEVDEQGTTAAAVTSIGVGVTSLPAIPSMLMNRPFIFVIRENHTNTVLFMGKVMNIPQ